jgi:hypothetical protein
MHTPYACQGGCAKHCIPPKYGGNLRLMVLNKEAREFFAKEGRKGGKIAAKRMTPEQRREKMRRAAQARWAKAKKKNQ